MPATVQGKQRFGASGGPTDVTLADPWFQTIDASAMGNPTGYPMTKPGTGVTHRSFWQSHFLNCSVTPAGVINNVKWFLDAGAAWTGLTLFAGTTATYTQATGTQGVTGDDSGVATVNQNSGQAPYLTGARLSVPGSLTNPSTGKISDYVVLQIDLADTAALSNDLAERTVTWAWDET